MPDPKMFKRFSDEIIGVAKAARDAIHDASAKVESTSVAKTSIWKDPETAKVMRVYTPEQWEALTAEEKKEYEELEPKRADILRAQHAEQLIKEKIQKSLEVFDG